MKKKILKIWEKLLNFTRKEIDVTYCEIVEIMKHNDKIILLDVRSLQEYQEYHLNAAINIPLYELRQKVERLIPKDSIVVVYCQSGIRSKKACKYLDSMGYSNLYNLEGGLDNI